MGRFAKVSTNNIARRMVRGGRKIRFRPPKICFLSVNYLRGYATPK
jgi:hypothetical protein